ncbi:enoyl-CoA hydratase/isomerase family protein [Ferroacidibacillus organovorans]|nr:enoyl-CoA hydratase-related protein [Ferroacidibacillus organovorans]
MNSFVTMLKQDGVATVEVNNPPMNVMSRGVGEGLKEAFEALAADQSVQAIVLTGSGERAFMAGANIKEFPDALGNPGQAYAYALSLHDVMAQIEACGKPVIAALFGYVLGGGLELALACDFRVCDEQTMLGLPEIKLGIFPGGGGTQRLPRLIGIARAMELMMSGEPISARRAHELGMVNRIAPGSSLDEALAWARQLSKHSLPALAAIKAAVREGIDRPLVDGLRIEAERFDQIFQTQDSREGIEAFLEKRKPIVRHQ